MRKDWEYKKFEDVFNLQMGKTPDRKNYDLFQGSNIWVSIRDLRDKYISSSNEYISDKAASNIKVVPKGTVIMSFKLSIGKCAIAAKDLYTNEAIMAFNIKDGHDIDSSFLYYYLQGYKWANANKAVMGITLNKAIISEHIIGIPPKPTQLAIVAELDKINELIQLKKQQLKDYDQLAQSIFYEMFGDPVENEKGWEVKKLGEVCETSSGGTPSKTHTEYYENGTIPWLRSGEVSQGYIYDAEIYISELGLNKSSAKIFPKDTVLIAMYGATVGEVGILCNPMCTNQAICGILPNDLYNSEFLRYVLLSHKDKYLSLASGGAQPNISQQIIKSTLIPFIDKPLQQQFAARIEAIERQKQQVSETIKDLETLLASRMQYWFD